MITWPIWDLTWTTVREILAFPRSHCPPFLFICQSRPETSLAAVNPNTCSIALSKLTNKAFRIHSEFISSWKITFWNVFSIFSNYDTQFYFKINVTTNFRNQNWLVWSWKKCIGRIGYSLKTYNAGSKFVENDWFFWNRQILLGTMVCNRLSYVSALQNNSKNVTGVN